MIESYREAVAYARREYLGRVMKEAGYQVLVAAKLAEKNRTEFYKLLEKYAPDLEPIPLPKEKRRKRRYQERRVNEGNAAWRALGDV